jgi:hypothetical protein
VHFYYVRLPYPSLLKLSLYSPLQFTPIRTGDPQEKTGRHTNMSIMHIDKVDIAHLDKRERAIIADSESRRFKFPEEGPIKRVGTSSPYSLGVRKRVREGEGESDDDEAGSAEQANVEEECRL